VRRASRCLNLHPHIDPRAEALDDPYQAVERNPDRFPKDFMLQLTNQEFKNLKSQFVISNLASPSWGGRRYAP
jgi:hypothetical protein